MGRSTALARTGGRGCPGIEKYTRPPLFSCVRCTDVLLECDIQELCLLDNPPCPWAPAHGATPTFSPNIAPNTDGFDPDSIQDVVFTDSYVSNGDDAIAIEQVGIVQGTGLRRMRALRQHHPERSTELWRWWSFARFRDVRWNLKRRHGATSPRKLRHRIKTGVRAVAVKNVSIDGVEIIGTTEETIHVDAFYGMVNTWCPDPNKRIPSVVDDIRISNVAVRNANVVPSMVRWMCQRRMPIKMYPLLVTEPCNNGVVDQVWQPAVVSLRNALVAYTIQRRASLLRVS